MNLLQASLLGGAAFRAVDDLLADLTFPQASQALPGVSYTLGDLLAHLQVTMRVSLDLITGKVQAWPDDLNVWPAAPASEPELKALLTDLHLLLSEANMLAADPGGLTRDILLDLAVHNAYHWGQVALIRQQQGVVFPSARET